MQYHTQEFHLVNNIGIFNLNSATSLQLESKKSAKYTYTKIQRTFFGEL